MSKDLNFNWPDSLSHTPHMVHICEHVNIHIDTDTDTENVTERPEL